MVDQPRRESAGNDHSGSVDSRDKQRHAEIGMDESAYRLMAPVEVGSSAQPEIDRPEHKACAMSDRHGEGPEPELRRSYPRQRPRMAPADEPEDTEPDDQEAGADLNLSLPFDEGEQQHKGED